MIWKYAMYGTMPNGVKHERSIGIHYKSINAGAYPVPILMHFRLMINNGKIILKMIMISKTTL